MRTSVVICTYNPRPEYLAKTLDSIAPQVSTESLRECIVVDNNSPHPVTCDRNWVRVVREPRQGLTAARLRGIREAIGNLIVFVDDDNVLSPDYLGNAEGIAQAWPQIGVFGGGTLPEFEKPPPEWLTPFFAHLAIVPCAADAWSNQRDHRAFPIGAGMCIRRTFAQRYADELERDAERASLGRTGSSLISGEDTDIVLTALRSGAGTGRFTKLSLTHLIPKERLEYGYNRRLAYAMGYSAGKLTRHYDGVTISSSTLQVLRTIAATLSGVRQGKAGWIAASAKYGYLRGLTGLSP